MAIVTVFAGSYYPEDIEIVQIQISVYFQSGNFRVAMHSKYKVFSAFVTTSTLPINVYIYIYIYMCICLYI